MEEYGKTREQLYQKVEADPTNPILLSAPACADVALNRKKKAIEEGRRALEMRPISEDQVRGPFIAFNFCGRQSAYGNGPGLQGLQVRVAL
jgi:hypothetical protein